MFDIRKTTERQRQDAGKYCEKSVSSKTLGEIGEELQRDVDDEIRVRLKQGEFEPDGTQVKSQQANC